MEGKGSAGRRKRDEISSLRSENSQGTPEAKRTDNTLKMADKIEDDVLSVTSDNTVNVIETRSYSQDR